MADRVKGVLCGKCADCKKRKFKHQNLGHQDDSPLMKLPAELRNEIYELALTGHEQDISRNKKNGHRAKAKAPGLLLACKQTYAEATPIYYSITKFLIRGLDGLQHPSMDRPKRALLAWANKIGPKKLRWVTCIGYEKNIHISPGRWKSSTTRLVVRLTEPVDTEFKGFRALFDGVIAEALQVKLEIYVERQEGTWTREPLEVAKEWMERYMKA